MGNRSKPCTDPTRQPARTACPRSRPSAAGSHATYATARGRAVEHGVHHVGARSAARRVEHDEVGLVRCHGRAQPVVDRCGVDRHVRQVVEVAPGVGAGAHGRLDRVDATVLPQVDGQRPGEQPDPAVEVEQVLPRLRRQCRADGADQARRQRRGAPARSRRRPPATRDPPRARAPSRGRAGLARSTSRASRRPRLAGSTTTVRSPPDEATTSIASVPFQARLVAPIPSTAAVVSGQESTAWTRVRAMAVEARPARRRRPRSAHGCASRDRRHRPAPPAPRRRRPGVRRRSPADRRDARAARAGPPP